MNKTISTILRDITIAIIAAFLLSFGTDPSLGVQNIFVMMFWLACILVCLALYYGLNKYDMDDRLYRSAFSDHIETYQKVSGEMIYRNLGWEVSRILNNVDDTLIDDGYRFARKILHGNEKVKNDGELKFFILMRLSRFALIAYNFPQAVYYTEQALEIKPGHLLARVRLAGAYEYAGMGEKAIAAYESLSSLCEAPCDISKYADQQISRIKRQGPKKPSAAGLFETTYF